MKQAESSGNGAENLGPEAPRKQGVVVLPLVLFLVSPCVASLIFEDMYLQAPGTSGMWAMAGLFQVVGMVTVAIALVIAIEITVRRRTARFAVGAIWAMVIAGALMLVIIEGLSRGPYPR